MKKTNRRAFWALSFAFVLSASFFAQAEETGVFTTPIHLKNTPLNIQRFAADGVYDLDFKITDARLSQGYKDLIIGFSDGSQSAFPLTTLSERHGWVKIISPSNPVYLHISFIPETQHFEILDARYFSPEDFGEIAQQTEVLIEASELSGRFFTENLAIVGNYIVDLFQNIAGKDELVKNHSYAEFNSEFKAQLLTEQERVAALYEIASQSKLVTYNVPEELWPHVMMEILADEAMVDPASVANLLKDAISATNVTKGEKAFHTLMAFLEYDVAASAFMKRPFKDAMPMTRGLTKGLIKVLDKLVTRNALKVAAVVPGAMAVAAPTAGVVTTEKVVVAQISKSFPRALLSFGGAALGVLFRAGTVVLFAGSATKRVANAYFFDFDQGWRPALFDAALDLGDDRLPDVAKEHEPLPFWALPEIEQAERAREALKQH